MPDTYQLAADYGRKLAEKELGQNRRVRGIIERIRENMETPKTGWEIPSSVLDEPGAVDRPLIVRKGLAIRKKLEFVPVSIWPGQLIAGSFVLPGEHLILNSRLPQYATDKELETAQKEGLSPTSIVGHIVPSYPRLLRTGTSALIQKAETRGKETSGDKAAFFQAVAFALEGVELFAGRLADLCRKEAAAAGEPSRQRELKQMAANLEQVPYKPPETFWQAVNAVWLLHLAFQLTGNHLAMGRCDQYLYPFLARDLEAGRTDLRLAQEVIDCFFLKFNERARDNDLVREETDLEAAQKRNDERWRERSPFAHSTQKYNIRDSIDATNHWLQNVIIGGITPESGEDATNLLTLMCLEAFRRNEMTNPCLTLRLHAETPDFLLDRAVRCLITGGGLPALFNDETIVPSLVESGFPPADARDYTNDGCWEVIVPGRTDFYFDRFNMLKCLEWTLNRGRSRIDGKKEAPDPGDPRNFSSYGEIIDHFRKMLAYQLEGLMDKISANFGRRAVIAPTPLLSAFLEGPLASGRDMTAGGARFVTFGLIAEGVAHVIDSLAAIRKVIFEEKYADISKLVCALDVDFNGFEDLHKKLSSAPKYGNNDPYADRIGQEILDQFTSILHTLDANYEKITFLPGIGTFSWYIAIGEGVGPTPDGRRRAAPVSSNFSPAAGAASQGITGSILSHAAMETQKFPVGSPTDLRIRRSLVSGREGHQRLAGLIRSFVDLGGNMLTLTVADVETLRRAQKEPEKYRELRVRMGGWSAYFTMLSKKQQEHHIQKQEKL